MTLLARHPRRAGVLVSLLTTGLLGTALETGFPRLVRFVPLSLQRDLPPAVSLLAQSSKRGLMPHDYTALLGDSSAEGDGDWHRSAGGTWPAGRAGALRQAMGLGPAPIPDPTQPLRVPALQAVNHARVGTELVALPDRLQGPALELTDEELRVSQWMFQQAVVFTTRHWPATRFVIVVLPSPLSCYALEGDCVSAQSYEGRGPIFPRVMVRRNSDSIADEVRRVAGAAGVGFIDARPALAAAAAQRLIHGPRDWKHLNRSGYEALARAILAGLPRQQAEHR